MPGPQWRVRPKESTEFLLNPHKGCATFQHFNGDPLFEGTHWSESGPTEFPPRQYEGTTPGYLPSTLAYCRWFWDLLEPEEGRYDWTVIDKALQTARERGQTLQVRLMPHGSAKQPQLPQWYQDKYPTTEGKKLSGGFIAAVYDSPEFIDRWGSVVTAFGERYDGHPDLESVDVSFIGPWGEGAGECSKEGIDKMMSIYAAAHTETPLVCMISGYKMEAGIKAGMGWRCDCLGDLGFWQQTDFPDSPSWNHHYDCYPREVCVNGAQDAWQHAPVIFESCGVPMSWYNKGFSLDFIVQQALKFHGSTLMPKSARMPEEWMDALAAFCNDLGYRFVLRQFLYEKRVTPGGFVRYEIWIENVGVAPIYRQYPLALKLSQGNREHVVTLPDDIRSWLPGDVWLIGHLRVPESFKPGEVMLHAGIIDPETEQPKVRFAVQETDEKGWVPLDTVEVK